MDLEKLEELSEGRRQEELEHGVSEAEPRAIFERGALVRLQLLPVDPRPVPRLGIGQHPRSVAIIEAKEGVKSADRVVVEHEIIALDPTDGDAEGKGVARLLALLDSKDERVAEHWSPGDEPLRFFPVLAVGDRGRLPQQDRAPKRRPSRGLLSKANQ